MVGPPGHLKDHVFMDFLEFRYFGLGSWKAIIRDVLFTQLDHLVSAVVGGCDLVSYAALKVHEGQGHSRSN